MIAKYCSTCRAETRRYASGRCGPCQDGHTTRYRARQKARRDVLNYARGFADSGVNAIRRGHLFNDDGFRVLSIAMHASGVTFPPEPLTIEDAAVLGARLS